MPAIVARHPEQRDFSYETLPLDDAKVYKLFSEGRTESVFQFESAGMQRMLKDVAAVGSDVEWLPMSAAGVEALIRTSGDEPEDSAVSECETTRVSG